MTTPTPKERKVAEGIFERYLETTPSEFDVVNAIAQALATAAADAARNMRERCALCVEGADTSVNHMPDGYSSRGVASWLVDRDEHLSTVIRAIPLPGETK